MKHNGIQGTMPPNESTPERLDSQSPSPIRGRPSARYGETANMSFRNTTCSTERNSPSSPYLPSHSFSRLNDDFHSGMPPMSSQPLWPRFSHPDTQSTMSSDPDVSGHPVPDEIAESDFNKRSSSPTFISTSPMRPFHIEDQQSSPSYRSTTPIQDDSEPTIPDYERSPSLFGDPVIEALVTPFEPWSTFPDEEPVIWDSQVNVEFIPFSASGRTPYTPPRSVIGFRQSYRQDIQPVPLPQYEFPERDSLAPEYLLYQPQEHVVDEVEEVDYFGNRILSHETLPNSYDWQGGDTEEGTSASLRDATRWAGDSGFVFREGNLRGEDGYDLELDAEMLLLGSYEQERHADEYGSDSDMREDGIDDGDENDADDEWPM